MQSKQGRGPTPGPVATEAELAAYVAETCSELRSLCPAAPFRAMNYLLDQVRLEAERLARAGGAERLLE